MRDLAGSISSHYGDDWSCVDSVVELSFTWFIVLLFFPFFCLFAFFSPVASLKLTCLLSPPSSKTLLLSQGWLPLWKYHIHFAYLPKPTWLDWYLPNSFLFPLSSYVLPSKLLCYLVKSDRYNMCILYIIFWKRGLRRDHSVTASIWKITIRW